MKHFVRESVACALLCVLSCVAIAPTYAAPTSSSGELEAARLKDEGDVAMKELRYVDALKSYDAAWSKQHQPAIRYNRGRAYEALGKIAEALAEFEAFLIEAPAELRAKVEKLPDHVAELKKKVTDVTIDVEVVGARVVVGTQIVGTTPLAGSLRLPAGKTIIEIVADGYAPYRKEVDLPGGGRLTIAPRLAKRDTRSTTMLSVSSDPPASVAIDGHAVGTSPIESTVEPGTHTVTLSRSGYSTRTSSVVVVEGDRKELRLSLEGESGIASKWWFWTSIGVVVIGATIVTTALVTTRDAGHGDIAPGRISAPMFKF